MDTSDGKSDWANTVEPEANKSRDNGILIKSSAVERPQSAIGGPI
jgi:hypothetical protein